MSTLEVSKSLILLQAVRLTLVSFLLLSGSLLLFEDSTQANVNWSYTEAGTREETRARQEGGSWVWKRLLTKNKPQEIQKDNDGEEAFARQAQKMEKSRGAGAGAKVIPKPSNKMEKNSDKDPRKIEKNKNSKKDVVP
jgi:hypothetical protein